MSRLDFTVQEKVYFELNKQNRTTADTDSKFLKENDTLSKMQEEIDLQDWLEIFEEDQVKLQGCR